MKKLFPDAPDVPQSVANRGVRIVERYLRVHRADRVKDLPEEAKVRLYRDLKEFFEVELGSGSGTGQGRESRQGILANLLQKLEDFLSFSEVSLAFYLPLNLCANSVYCDGYRQVAVTSMQRSGSRQ
jgi:hypothetical protein